MGEAWKYELHIFPIGMKIGHWSGQDSVHFDALTGNLGGAFKHLQILQRTIFEKCLPLQRPHTQLTLFA